MKINQNCPDCGTTVGNRHKSGCDVERCMYCGGQFISCDCDNDYSATTYELWSGYWPGEMECIEYGFIKDGQTDLNRLRIECVWDKESRRWVKEGKK